MGGLGAAIDSNRSLLSARDVENIRAAKAYAAKCKGSKTKAGKIHTHVYHIYEGGSGYGLQEKNAADTLGDMGFIVAGGGSQYYKGGYIAMLHIGVTQWGKYLPCNHPAGSHTYSCNGGTYQYAGRVTSCYSFKGECYSFPAAGKNKEWSEMDDKSGPCMVIRIKAKCMYNEMAKAGSCKSGCDSVPSYSQCAQCWKGLGASQMKQVWDNAIWGHKCHRYETEEEDELNDENSAVANTTAPTDKGAFLV